MATVVQERLALSPAVATAAAAVAERLRAGTVEVRSERHGNGSGVIWSADGLIVTNHHVAHTNTAEVALADGRVLPAQVIARDPERDLAALRVQATDLPAVQIGDSTALHVGQLVLAMGNPLGLKGALTLGIIHATAGTIQGMGDGASRWIRADVRLAPGNSGGPLADALGHVIGINSMIAGGLALAVPSAAVQRFLSSGAQTAFLGVSVQPVALPEAFARQARTQQQRGLLALGVEEDGPAAQAGLLPGDILLAANRWVLRHTNDLLNYLREATAQAPFTLHVLRGGIPREVTGVLGVRAQETQ